MDRIQICEVIHSSMEKLEVQGIRSQKRKAWLEREKCLRLSPRCPFLMSGRLASRSSHDLLRKISWTASSQPGTPNSHTCLSNPPPSSRSHPISYSIFRLTECLHQRARMSSKHILHYVNPIIDYVLELVTQSQMMPVPAAQSRQMVPNSPFQSWTLRFGRLLKSTGPSSRK
jgi:hypothetical protein